MRFSLVYRLVLLGSLLFSTGALLGADSEDYPFITVASTMSMEQSGLLGYLIPAFRQTNGIDVYVVAVGTGEALEIGERGECDVVLVHDKTRELEFMRNGFGSVRREVMYNDLVVVGPRYDPVKIDASHDAVAALRKIAAARARFVSRGDLSGAEAAEERLWAEAGGAPTAVRDLWYVKTGGGMEQTLAAAASTNGYTLTDRGTWVHYRDRNDLKIVVEDPRLFNQYAVILVSPARHPQVKTQMGMAFIDWLTSPAGQAKIASYKVDDQQLFFPDYVQP